MDWKFKPHQKFYLFWKRVIGLFGSILGILLCASLIWWWVIIVNAIVTKGHPFFVQQRIGKNKKVFGMIKFRSMRVDANPNLAPSDMNAKTQNNMETGFGKFLRKTSIDETPQLLNIFVGQMAFIGPRPGAAVNEEELIKLRESYTPNAYMVKPGISGYAQTHMKRSHDPAGKAYHDHWYVEHLSLFIDVKLFILSILCAFGYNKGR